MNSQSNGTSFQLVICTLILGLRLADSIQTYEIQSGGFARTVYASVPSGGAARKPLVVVLHGAGGSGKTYLEKNGWVTESQKGDFVVIAPDGLPSRPRMEPSFQTNPRVWNSGQLNPLSPRSRIDDVEFLASMIRDAATRFPVKDQPVFMTGHSNGTGMTFRFAYSHPEMLAAIAPILGQNLTGGQPLKKGVATLYMLGTEDPLNPLNGGTQKTRWASQQVPPVQTSIDKWARSLAIENPPNVVRNDGDVEVRRYQPGKDGATFEVWFLKGQGHAWPGGQASGLPESVLGPNPSRVNATKEIWKFFHGVASKGK